MSQLPSFDGERTISQEKIDFFAENGHVRIKQLCSKNELTHFSESLIRVGTDIAWNKDIPLEKQRTYDRAFHQSINLWKLDPVAEAFVTAKRFAHVAAQLLQVKGVRLYHDQLLNKKAQGGHTPWHQDAYYWPIKGSQAITMWMPLADIDSSMGLVQFAERSHLRGDLKGSAISGTSETEFSELVQREEFSLSSYEFFSAGDATFHAGWTLHRAGENTTERDRPAMTVIYIADECRIQEIERNEQRLDLLMYLPGVEEGDLAVSPMNPLLWYQDWN